MAELRTPPSRLRALLILLISAAAAATLIGVAGPSSGADAAAEQPNFIHVLTDDQTIDSLVHMRRTERLVKAEGTSFVNHFATQPLCCPSRASFLTGQYPHNHGVLSNEPPYGFAAMDFENTLYTALDDAGYRTGWIGKVLNAQGSEAVEPPSRIRRVARPDRRRRGRHVRLHAQRQRHRPRGRGRVPEPLLQRPRVQLPRDAAASEPFLLTLALNSPHWSQCPGPGPVEGPNRCPPQPAPRDRDAFPGLTYPFGPDFTAGPSRRAETNRWWRREVQSLQSVDRVVASLVKQLRQAGELDNTYLIFQSDNGMLHGERGIFDKDVAWDRSVRIPLLIRGPGFEPGSRRADMTANVDVPATILDAAGVEPPRPLDGYSLLGDHERHQLLLRRVIGTKAQKRHPWTQLRTSSGWTYWRDVTSGHERLYNQREDPYQVQNLIRKRPALADRLAARVAAIQDCAAPCP